MLYVVCRVCIGWLGKYDLVVFYYVGEVLYIDFLMGCSWVYFMVLFCYLGNVMVKY